MNTIDLDDFDKLKLENLLLKEQISSLSNQIADIGKEDRRKSLYNELVSKYNIDINKFKVKIDAPNSKIVLVEKEQAPD